MAKQKTRKKDKGRSKKAVHDSSARLTTKAYEKEIERLRGELVKLQYWVQATLRRGRLAEGVADGSPRTDRYPVVLLRAAVDEKMSES